MKLLAFPLCLALACTASAQAAPPARGAAPTDVQASLKAALKEAKPKLGTIEIWQSSLYDEEVLSQPSRFVRDYRPGAGGLIAEIDYEGIRSFLELSGFPSRGDPESMQGSVSKQAPVAAPSAVPGLRFVLALDTESNPAKCAPCAEALAPLRRNLKAKLEKRGFTVAFVTPEEVAQAQGSIAVISEKLSELIRRPGTAGGMVLQWREAPTDSIDSAHADEKHFLVRSVHLFTVPGETGVSKELRAERQALLMENDSMQAAGERLFTESWIENGARAIAQRRQLQQEKGSAELWIAVSGVPDFMGYQRIRSALQAQTRAWGELEDRKFSPGQVVFAIRTGKPASELAQALSAFRAKVVADTTVQLDWRSP